MVVDIIVYSEKLEKKLKEELGKEATPEFLNLIRAGIAAHEHSFAEYGITKEKYIEWISQAWNAGTHQKKVYNMEVEGGVNNEWGVAMNFGGYLSLFGQREGYVNQTKEE